MTPFDADAGTVEFKISAYELFSNENIILIPGPIGIRLFREGDKLTFIRVEPPDGMRTANVDISGLDKFDTFHIFMTWSEDDINLHIGPVPAKVSELRSDHA